MTIGKAPTRVARFPAAPGFATRDGETRFAAARPTPLRRAWTRFVLGCSLAALLAGCVVAPAYPPPPPRYHYYYYGYPHYYGY
ncbi:MAG TPA: hypothetical protein VKY65_15185 [Alphaproteobacteria bacterium]|nr:hypothetical protein [Alphaproteobacteria bacterium]